MRDIVKEPEPQSLTDHRARPFSDYDNYQEKADLRESLVREQRGLCCYCLCRISPDQAEMKIEHWHCQDRYPLERLDYANLLGACRGGEKANHTDEREADRHCDTFKENRDLSRSPAILAHHVEQTISYLPDGRLRSTDPVFDAELSSVLNLNGRTLINRRKGVMQAFLQLNSKRPHMTRQQWEDAVRDWSGETNNGKLRPYAPLVVFWIKKYILRIA